MSKEAAEPHRKAVEHHEHAQWRLRKVPESFRVSWRKARCIVSIDPNPHSTALFSKGF